MSQLSREVESVCHVLSSVRQYSPLLLSIVEILIATGCSPEVIAQQLEFTADVVRSTIAGMRFELAGCEEGVKE